MQVFPVLMLLVTMLLGAAPAAAGSATIAVAANFRPVAEKLLPLIEAQTSHRYTLVTGSSGKLAAQILNGAPFDVFMAADRARPQALVSQGLGRSTNLVGYAVGQLALWTPGAAEPPQLSVLQAPWPSQLVIANPRLAPYGAAAQSLLEAQGLWPQRRGQIVLADNAAAAFGLVNSGSVGMGLVAVATLKAGDIPEQQYVCLDSRRHAPIEQAMLLLAHAEQNPAARDWFEWVRSERMRSILPAFGYLLPGPAPAAPERVL